MSKADGDPRAKGEENNVKPSSSTSQDDVPPVHVLEAAERQDRKETADLLAGFDRPGRGPKAPSRERDFVDYYAKKPGGADSGSGRAASASAGAGADRVGQANVATGVAQRRGRPGDVSTVIIPRKSEGAPAWLVWGGAALLMLAVGGVVAFVATADGRPGANAVVAAPVATGAVVASAATTLTAATAAVPTVADENVPPAAASLSPAAVVAPVAVVPVPVAVPRASGAARREPRGEASAPRPTTTAAEAPKAAPRDDSFLRDL